MASPRARSGYAFAVAAAVLFGLVNVAGKASTLDPLVKAAGAYLIAGAVLAPMLRGVRVARRDWRIVLVMSASGGAAAPLLLFQGLTMTGAADASLILTLEMVFTAILAAAVLRERLPLPGWAGLALLLGSAAVVAVGTGDTADAPERVLGDAFVAAAALGWAIDNAASTALAGRYRPHHLIGLKGLIGGALVLAALVVRGDGFHVPAGEWGYLAFIGLVGIAASTVVLYHSLQRIGATRSVGVFIPGAAFVGALGAWVWLGEPLGWRHLVAALLLLAGVTLVVAAEERQARSL